MALGVVVLFVMSLFSGVVDIPEADVLAILAGGDVSRPVWRFIVLESRLPQALTALLCGGALAVGGLMLQTVFRNPLADPSVFGISSGAGLGVAFVMLAAGGGVVSSAFSLTGFLAVVSSAFAGAMVVTVIVLLVSKRVRNSVLLVIVGIMIGYVASSAITILNFFATEQGVRSYVFWGMGDFGGVPMTYMPVFALVIVACLLFSFTLVKPLNVFLLGEQYAENLGVNVGRLRNEVLVLVGLLTAVTTAFCGPVAFVGLAVPHVARLLLRTDNHRALLPVTVLAGCAVALACNIVCNIRGDRGVIPLNAVTPLIGAPVIIYVLLGRNKYSQNIEY